MNKDASKSVGRSLFSRTFTLVIVPFGMWYVSMVYAMAADLSPLVAVLTVVVGSMVIMITMTLLSHHWVTCRSIRGRFDLYTVMLSIIPLATYLAGIRQVLIGARMNMFGPREWVFVTIICVFFIAISSILLLLFAEALMWIVVAIQRTIWRKH